MKHSMWSSFRISAGGLHLSAVLAVLLMVGPPLADADTFPPTLVFQSPASDAVVGGIERFKVEVSDQDGLAASNPVRSA